MEWLNSVKVVWRFVVRHLQRVVGIIHSRKGKATPKKKPKPKSEPEEYKRFLETAGEVGAGDDPQDFDEAFKQAGRLAPRRQPKPS